MYVLVMTTPNSEKMFRYASQHKKIVQSYLDGFIAHLGKDILIWRMWYNGYWTDGSVDAWKYINRVDGSSEVVLFPCKISR